MRLLSILALVLLALTAMAQERQMIVRLQPGADPRLIAQKYRLVLRDQTADAPFALYGVPRYVSVATVQPLMNADPAIVWAEDNAEVASPEGTGGTKGSTMPALRADRIAGLGTRDDLQNANTTVLSMINWNSALANSSGRTVRVAILDTGLSQLQPGLWNQVDASTNFIETGLPAYDRPWGRDTDRNGIVDETVGHGTMVAGIVDQIAPQVRLVVARVMDSDGYSSAWLLTKGIAFAVTSGAEVANISIGSKNRIAAMSDVIEWAEGRGLLIVGAIGNINQRVAFSPSSVGKVICVTGLNPNRTKAVFSNWEGTADVAAPATGIRSQWWDGNMAVWSGTSFAAPMVAAAAADCLRRTAGPISVATLRQALQDHGTSINNVNSAYKDRLGKLLNVVQLNSFLVGGP